MEGMEMNFGEYIESIRKARRKSLRETARAIGVSAPYFSDVERGRRCAFTAERLEALKVFLEMSSKEANDMYDKAAKSYSSKGDNVAVPQDISSYIVDSSYIISALRTLKEEEVDERDWENMVNAFLEKRKAQKAADGVKDSER